VTIKILIFTPTWETPGGLAIHPECEASIEAQVFDGETDWAISTTQPYPVPDHRNVLEHYRTARLWLLRADYDALLTVEHDNVLPDAGVLQRMWDTPGDVIYAPYMLRHGMRMLSTWQYINDRNLGMSLSNYPYELAAYKRQGYGRVCGVGYGCTLFRRHTLERLEFRDGQDGVQVCPDIPFAEDALRAGFVSMGRFDAPIAHYENGLRLDAYGEIPTVQYIAKQTVNAIADGTFLRLVAGQTYTLTPTQAADLVRVGYIDTPQPTAPATAAIEPTQRAVPPKAQARRAK
jgi:hypothetical protein